MPATQIPIHDFSKDDASSISFKLLPLERKETYDTSVPHRHNYYEIFYFEKGGGYHDIDFEQIPIEDQSIHFVSPGQVHLVRRALDSNGIVIFFSRDFFYLNLSNKDILFELPFLNNNSKYPILNLQEAQSPQFSMLFRQLSSEYEGKNPYKEDLLRSYLNILLLECRRLFDAKEEEDNLSQDVPSRKQFKEFKILLEKNYLQLRKVQDYAAMMAITDKYLNEICKRSAGMTASELVHDRVILEARRLLLHSGLNNKEIAYFLGFEDPSHFSKFFKNKTSMTPSQFRKSLQQQYGS